MTEERRGYLRSCLLKIAESIGKTTEADVTIIRHERMEILTKVDAEERAAYRKYFLSRFRG